MEQAVYYLDSLRTRRAQRNSHLAAGLGMLLVGIEGLAGDHPGALYKGTLEIIAGGLLFGVVIYEMIQAKKEHRHELEWADFFAALVAIVEGVTKIHPAGLLQSRLSMLWFVVAIMFILKGLYISKLPKWSRFIFTEHDFIYRKPPFRRQTIPWNSIKDVQITEEILMIENDSGQVTRIALNDFAHSTKVVQWCREQIPRFRQWAKEHVVPGQ